MLMATWLTGDAGFTSYDYDLVAVALNERFMDRGHDQPIPYRHEL